MKLSNILTAAAGVLLFDFVWVRWVAPKVLPGFSLGPETGHCPLNCSCKSGGFPCPKNITDRVQTVDITPINRQGVSVSV